jgi:GNAT superfamily N-acetyltransferase
VNVVPIIRPAAPGDADEVVALVRQSFRPEDLGLTIYGCTGMPAYLRLEFARPRSVAASVYLVAAIDNRVAGFVELRRGERGPCLNYIVTNPCWRRAGVARGLLEAALWEADAPAGSELTLDVFEHNETARNWYQRAGFRCLQQMAFCRVVPGDGPAEKRLRISGLPQADVTHRAFGFSSFAMTHGGRSFTIGRLAERWFRVNDGELLRYPETLRALQAVEPHRGFLFHGAEEAVAGQEGCSSLLRSIRMGRIL